MPIADVHVAVPALGATAMQRGKTRRLAGRRKQRRGAWTSQVPTPCCGGPARNTAASKHVLCFSRSLAARLPVRRNSETSRIFWISQKRVVVRPPGGRTSKTKQGLKSCCSFAAVFNCTSRLCTYQVWPALRQPIPVPQHTRRPRNPPPRRPPRQPTRADTMPRKRPSAETG